MRAFRVLVPFLVATAAIGGCKNADDDGAGGAGGGSGGASTTTSTGDGGAGGRDGAGGDAATTTTTTSTGGGDGAGGEGGGAPAECWDPTPASGEDSFVAVDGANTHTFELTLPDDPEGGLVTLELAGHQAFASVRVVGGGDGSVLGFSVAGDGDEASAAEASFVGAPGVTYAVDVEETWVTATEREATVELAWTLATTHDCFEPNDTAEEAVLLPLGEAIEAYSFAGYIANEWPSYEAHDDFYRIEVTEAGTLTITMAPSLEPLALRIAPAAQPEVPLTDGFTIDETPLELAAEVEPGSYVVRVQPFTSPIFNSFDGEITTWNDPYTLRATLE